MRETQMVGAVLRFCILAVLFVVTMGSGFTALAGAFFLVGNIGDRSPHGGWTTLFLIWLVVGAVVCWASAMGLRYVWRDHIKHGGRNGASSAGADSSRNDR